MIRVYTAPGSQSCRKVIAWLKEHNLSFIEKNIFSSDLHANLSKNSKIIKSNKIDFDNMKMDELIAFIKANPSILKRPILMDEHRFQVGYNEEEIRTFIPRHQRG